MMTIDDYDVGNWLEQTGWRSKKTDMEEMLYIYNNWIMTSPKSGPYDSLDVDLLIKKTISRMTHIHPNPVDAHVISSLLILYMSKLAISERVIAPKLTNLIN